MVTDDFEAHSPYMTWHVMGIGIHHIVQALVALNVGTTVPLLLLPLVDILQSVLAAARQGDSAPDVATGTLPPPSPLLSISHVLVYTRVLGECIAGAGIVYACCLRR